MGLVYDELDTGATFSECRSWRYKLWRVWDKEKPNLVVIGLNPSTADETLNDPTIRRCIGFAKSMYFGGYVMLNLFAFRATDPKVMKSYTKPVGKDNDLVIRSECNDAIAKGGKIVAAWGTHGSYLNRDKEVMKLLKDDGLKVYCFGVTKDGYPKHPLYLKSDCVPVPYEGRA